MTSDIQKKIKEFKKELKKHDIRFEQVYIFGSVARGTQHEWSDIDVGVVGPAFAADRIDEMVKLRMIAYKIDPAIVPIPLRPEDMTDRFSTIGTAIRREGIKVE